MKDEITMYMTKMWYASIEEVKVERYTDNSVWIAGRRFGRFTRYERYFKTYMEAKQYLLETARRKETAARDQLSGIINRLEKIKQL